MAPGKPGAIFYYEKPDSMGSLAFVFSSVPGSA